MEDIQELVDRGVEVKYKPQTKREEINATDTATSLYHLVFQLEGAIGLEPTKQRKLIEQTIRVMQNRVNQYGLCFVEIRPVGTHQIEVTTPLVEYREVLRRLLGQTGDLRFCKVIEAGTSPNSDLVCTSATQEVLYNREGIPYIVESTPLLTGAALADANVHTCQSMQYAGQLYIAMTFNQEGAQQFVEALRHLKGDNPDTPQNDGDLLAIVLGHVIYSAPRITASIKVAAEQDWRLVQNSTTISGDFTKEEATRIAIVLRTGALPVDVSVVEENILPEVP
jgi:preprotein translocase subunit SecD